MKEAQELHEPTEQYFAQPLEVNTYCYATINNAINKLVLGSVTGHCNI